MSVVRSSSAPGASLEPGVMRPPVCIVDDNKDMRDVLARVTRAVGLKSELYESADAFLHRRDCSKIGCLLLDVQLSGMSGLELLEQLSAERAGYPIFLISGAHDAQTVAQAKRHGAIVVHKPFDARLLGQQLLAAVSAGRA